MKIYNVEIPPDLEIPELDAKTKAAIDAFHEENVRDQREKEERMKSLPEWQNKPVVYPYGPPRPPSINVEALRQLPPHTRAIFAYLHRDEITY
jgi:hypothetical protein